MAASVRSSSKANASSAGASWAIAMPAGAVAGDVVYVTIIMLNISSGRTANLNTEGFTILRNNDVASGNTKTSLFRRVLDGSEDATITGAFVGGSGNNWTAIAVCVQGADNTTPEDATTTATIAGASSVSHVCPTITAAGADDLLLCMAARNSNTGTYTWPTPPNELQDGGSTGCISMAEEALSASGATGTRTATCTAAGIYNTYSILVKSAGVNIAADDVLITLQPETPGVTTQTNVTTTGVVNEVLAPQTPNVTTQTNVTTTPEVPLVLTPEVPTVLTGTPVFPAAAPLVLSPQVPSVAQDNNITISEVPLVLAPQIPAVRVDVNVFADAVAMTLAAQIPAGSVSTSASPAAVPLVMAFPLPTATGSVAASPAAVSLTLAPQVPTTALGAGNDLSLYWDISGVAGADLSLLWRVLSASRITSTLTTDQLLDLEFVGVRSSCFRWEVLNSANEVIGTCNPAGEDQAPTITHDVTRAIKRDMSGFLLDPTTQLDINPQIHRIRPVMILQNNVEFEMGVYLFVDGSRSPHTYGSWFTGSLLDQCWVVDQATERTIGFERGSTITAALQTVLSEVPGVTVSIDSMSATLGSEIIWPAGASRLKIVNDLCALAGAYDLYFDNHGTGRVKLVPSDLTQIPVAVTYTEGSCGQNKAIGNLLEGSTVESDNLLDSPNRFIVIDNQAQAAPIVGVYDIPASAPNSFFNRGVRIVAVINEQGLGSTEAAVARAQAAAAQSAADYSWWSFQGVIDPRHDTYDILRVRGSLVREQKWSVQVREGAPMSHDVRLTFA